MSYEIQTKKDLLISTSLSHLDLYIAVADTDNVVTIYHLITGQKLVQLDLGENTVIKVQFMNNDMLMIATESSLLFYSPRFSRKNFEINKKMASEIVNNHKLNNKSKNLNIFLPEQTEIKKMNICPLLFTISFGEQSVVQANLHYRQNYIVVVNKNKSQHNLINVINLQKGTL